MTVEANSIHYCKGLQNRPGQTGMWRPTGFPPGGGTIPVIGAEDVRPLVPGLDLWDCWPLMHKDGRTATVGAPGEERRFWFFLSSAQFADPIMRHGHARIRLLSRRVGAGTAGGGGGWHDHGNALPDGLNPGTREWAGSAVLQDDGRVTLYYTVAGRRGEPELSFEQRLFAVTGTLQEDGIGGWDEPVELCQPDEVRYFRAVGTAAGEPGTIKAFRDPFFFRDPVTGRDHIVFTATAAWSDDPHNGMVGLATRTAAGWVLDDPLVDAVGVNNEMERAQVHFRGGRYYLLWSTQTHTFSPKGPAGPNGLYGMVADSIAGPWRPINGTSLVAANPADEAAQSYSWVVTGDNEVWSFVDYWGMQGRALADHPELLRAKFGGTAAPVFRLVFDGDSVGVA